MRELVIVLALTASFIVLERYGDRRRRRTSLPAQDDPPPRRPLSPEFDLQEAFRAGATIGAHRVRLEHVASLLVPSGKIVACDPLVFPDEPPFERSITPGTYPVDVSVVDIEPGHQRVAAMRLKITDQPPVTWVATETCYGVDAGLGCFMAAETATLLEQVMAAASEGEGNYYDDVLAKELEPDRDWTDHHPEATRANNIAIAHSGWGDGFYQSYWGLDARGEPAWLVTDFQVLRRGS